MASGKSFNLNYWWHQVMFKLFLNDQNMAQIDQFLSADPSHCKTRLYEAEAPVLKRCGANFMGPSLAVTELCCTYSAGPFGFVRIGIVVLLLTTRTP